MKSEPPTPTRATDNQLIKMQDERKFIRETSLLYISGVGVGGSYSIGDLTSGRARMRDMVPWYSML